MTTRKGRSLVVCVAAIITLAATGCGPDNTSASDAGRTAEASASSSVPSTAPETSAPPTTPPAATTAPATPTAAPETTQPEPTAIPTEPGQVILNPEPEVDGDPGGESWTEVGVGGITGDAKCNPDRKVIELELNGTVEVRGSEITVTQKSNGLVITTNRVLLATAVIVNNDAAGRLSSTWWNAGGNLSERSILLPASTWEPVIGGGEFHSIKVCSIKE